MNEAPERVTRCRGVLLGTAVGDALGLPKEGIPRDRADKMFAGRPRHRFLFGSGMVSDDTDHALFVAQSLLAHPDSPEDFRRRLAWCLRLWLLTLPAGVGFATLRSILKLWVGVDSRRSGVYSAGNGPAMRSAPIGAFFADSPERLDAYVDASTRITHTDPRALTGARAVALLTAWMIRDELREQPDVGPFIEVLRHASARKAADEEWRDLIEQIRTACDRELSVIEFADSLGLEQGVTGFVYHTVPLAAYAWYRHFGDFEATVSSVLACGGDTDTTGAIAGALAGAVIGDGGIPGDWLRGIWDWPRSRTLIGSLGAQLAECSATGRSCSPVRYFWFGLVPRNLLFLTVVLAHGLRRLLPPY
ncbi:MAG: ADP-ribosylglycohydrolase family protein [Acidobacteria bacterium]|nr:MAG: ADP-ribosylglycohydrolase family protein [Acidobacteriota bacterium]